MDNGFEFTTADVERDWQGGFVISRTTLVPDFVLGAAQAAWQVSYGADQQVFTTRLGWTVNGGQMEARYYYNGSNQPVHFLPGRGGWLLHRIRAPLAALPRSVGY